MTMSTSGNPFDEVLEYHSRTKHHLHRFAASLGYLDWATQPDPFRTFEGAETIDLPLSAGRFASAHYDDLYALGKVAASPLNRESIGALFELALGLSAWKQYEKSRWSLRCNPSSGNLHPTEGYAVLPQIPGLAAGVYHYLSRDHCLERRCVPGREGSDGLASILGGSFVVGLSSIHWREAWKYGERAFRYCQHDIGHAIATVRYAAAALGWNVALIDASDEAIREVLGLAHEEDISYIDEGDREHPGALLLVEAERLAAKRPGVAPAAITKIRDAVNSGTWKGSPNVLSTGHRRWAAIDVAARSTWRADGANMGDTTAVAPIQESAKPVLQSNSSGPLADLMAVNLIQQRRSAVAFDDLTSISSQTFFRMLDRLLPRPGIAPWDILPWSPHLHCGIFVHRVDGLAPGLYLFLRNPDSRERLKRVLHPGFLFEHPDGCPDQLALFKLMNGDFRRQAQLVSCQQKIAGTGAFSLGMIAEFRDTLHSKGPWWYRRLFWEAGVLGQVLYLEAEAAGVRGTGIGCYFDDAFHSILGLHDNQLQSLYHFTVGAPVEDTRLTTLAPYAHLSGGRVI